MKKLPETPLVSVVTPSYNTGRYIEETLRSVRDQDWPRVEHMVLDSGSTDETARILERFPTVRVITPCPPKIVGKVNLGFASTTGEIVAFLCADDYYLPGAISRAVEALKRHPEAGLVYANDLRVNEQSVEILRTRTKQTSHWELVNVHNWLTHQTVFMRREALEAVGGLDPRYPLAHDWDLWIRISKRFPIAYVDDWWGAFREREDQLSHTHQYRYWWEGWKLTRQHGAPVLSPYVRNYWGAKLARGAAMIRRGEFKQARLKLRKLVNGLGEL